MAIEKIAYRFVDAVPERIEEGILYLAMDYATAVHKCACGCGREVITPFSPTDWKMGYDGVAVSLSPSIGNWSFPCRSHYWIKRCDIQWASDMSDEKIAAGRAQDLRAKSRYYNAPETLSMPESADSHTSFWRRALRWLTGK